MRHLQRILLIAAVAAILTACNSHSSTHEHDGGSEHAGEHSGEGRGEHGGQNDGEHGGEHREGSGEHAAGHAEGGAHSAEHGEEDNTPLALDAKFNAVRRGAHLTLEYRAESNIFVGWVENVTDETLEDVRVEVHLSNGNELGPTEPVDLEPGGRQIVQLPAGSTDFETWSTHAEVGRDEHGGGEHGSEGGEHGSSGLDERGDHGDA